MLNNFNVTVLSANHRESKLQSELHSFIVLSLIIILFFYYSLFLYFDLALMFCFLMSSYLFLLS